MGAPRTRFERHDCICTPSRPHGHQHVYQVHRCGCDACRLGYRQYLADRADEAAAGRSAYVAIGPVTAQLKALGAKGWTGKAMARELGWSPAMVSAALTGRRPTCRRDFAEDVAALVVAVRMGDTHARSVA